MYLKRFSKSPICVFCVPRVSVHFIMKIYTNAVCICMMLGIFFPEFLKTWTSRSREQRHFWFDTLHLHFFFALCVGVIQGKEKDLQSGPIGSAEYANEVAPIVSPIPTYLVFFLFFLHFCPFVFLFLSFLSASFFVFPFLLPDSILFLPFFSPPSGNPIQQRR